MNRQLKWDLRYLTLAKLVASWSKDPSTQTGAVIVDRFGNATSHGFNGLARGVHDTPERLNNREIKYQIIVHCEVNAMLVAAERCRGGTLYTWPFMSCAACASKVIQVGIARCVAPAADYTRWEESCRLAREMFTEAGVQLNIIDIASIAAPKVAA